jgi:putative N6-adenine-specific DNA methylase
MKIIVKTLFGLEEILKKEIEDLGFKQVSVLNRAVELEGEWKDVYTLNYKCRVAIAVLVKIEEFRIKKEDDLYKEAKKIDWTKYFDVKKTFAVKGAVFSELFNHTQFPMLLVKDAIADVFRDKFEERPNVNVKSPQVLFDMHIAANNTVSISLNTSGAPLYQRGYRQGTGEAPLNEVLAAGLITLSGWDRKSTFIDPMCGSGTLVIEAALMAADIPAMVEREHYAFKNFTSFQPEVWEEVRDSANNRPIKLEFDIVGYDSDSEVLVKARRNARSAPVGNMVRFEIQEMNEIEVSAEKGTLICNPPYGERIGDEIQELYTQMGDVFKNKLVGFDCWVISSNAEALKFLGLRPDRKIKLFNGRLECSYRKFAVYEGSKRVRSADELDEEPLKKVEVKAPKKEKNVIIPVPQKAIKYGKPNAEHFSSAREDSSRNEEVEKIDDQNEEIIPKKYTGKPVIGKSKYATPDSPSSKVAKRPSTTEEQTQPTAKPKAERLTEEHTEPKPSRYSPKKVITESRQEKLERLKKGRG